MDGLDYRDQTLEVAALVGMVVGAVVERDGLVEMEGEVETEVERWMMLRFAPERLRRRLEGYPIVHDVLWNDR